MIAVLDTNVLIQALNPHHSHAQIMNPGKRPLNWILIVIALATTIIAIISFADFSGKPAPQWRQIALFTGLALCLLVKWLSIRSGRYK